jgi:serine/threonine protein kinase
VPLDRSIPSGGFPLALALRYASEITSAVAAAHAQGIIHRDLKPGNVMIAADGRVKVLDFGIARRMSLPDVATRPQTIDATIGAAGMLVGTAGYMAPEQIEGRPATERSDVFALGVMPFVSRGRTLTWEAAVASFRDTTGRPGPATWELGNFPDGQDDWPVNGVSWYEAAAYAVFAGKLLPTIYHWYRASGAFGVF